MSLIADTNRDYTRKVFLGNVVSAYLLETVYNHRRRGEDQPLSPSLTRGITVLTDFS